MIKFNIKYNLSEKSNCDWIIFAINNSKTTDISIYCNHVLLYI